MAQSGIPVPAPVVATGNKALENWRFFRAQWGNYEVATGLLKKPDKVRVATLLSVIGRECYDIFLNLDLTTDQRECVEDILAAFDKHFEPLHNIIFDRYIFNTAEQPASENIEQYVNRLRKLAATCEFGLLTDQLIRDRIVLGYKDIKVRSRLLQEPKLTLSSAIDICKSNEAAALQLRKIASTGVEEVHYSEKLCHFAKSGVQGSKSVDTHDSSAKAASCLYCGGFHEKGAKKCPAFGKVCKNCGKINHFARVCRQKHMAPRQLGNVNFMDDTENTDDSLFAVSHAVGAVHSKGRKWFADIAMSIPQRGTAASEKVTCQLDTGSTCNIIGFKDVCRVARSANPKMQHSSAKLVCYSGDLITPKGLITITCVCNRMGIQLDFQVVDTDHRPLISGEACERMGLLKFSPSAKTTLCAEDNTVCFTSPVEEMDIIEKYSDVFEGLGCLPGELHLTVDDSKPPVQHVPRRVPIALKGDLKMEIDRLVSLGVLCPVNTPTDWISSAVVVKRPGKMRICIDPKDLNLALKRSHYPMPTIADVLPKLSKARIFSVLDAKDGFWQVKMDKTSSFLTTFWTPFGRYRWLRMPFGISPASEEFQRRQAEALDGLQGADSVHDDILVYGCGDTDEEALADHDRNLKALLERARKVDLKLNKKKLVLRKKSVRFMGHLLTDKGLQADPEKIRAVTEMPRPTDVKEVQCFVGFVNYLAKFLPHLSEVCEPLRKLTTKDAAWSWQSQQEDAFRQIKSLVTQAPVLKYYDVLADVTIQCDASSVGLGATLLQDGQPVAFASRALTATEKNYAQIEKECLAIVFACDKFYEYLCGRSMIYVDTDHKPLETIFRKSLLSAPKRLQRMLLKLQRLHLEVRYKRGTEMFIADLLSRVFLQEATPDQVECDVFATREHFAFCKDLEQIDIAQQINVTCERLKQIHEETMSDPTLQTLKGIILKGWPQKRNELPASVQPYWQFREELTTDGNVLYKACKIVIPVAMKAEMLEKVHGHHMGMQSCIRRARDTLFWLGMNKDIQDYIGKCDICATWSQAQTKEPLTPTQTPKLPWQVLPTDLFEYQGKSYVIIVDYYSDFFEIDVLNRTNATTVIKKLKRHFSRYGIPLEVISDNSPPFSSSEFEDFAKEWEFRHSTSSPYHSQGNGKAEAAVKIAKNLLRKATQENQDIWLALLNFRNTPTEKLESSPAQRLFSRRTRTLVPATTFMLKPTVQTDVPDRKKDKQEISKKWHDQSSKQLNTLDVGEFVRVEPHPNKKKEWRVGKIIRRIHPRSYIVEVDGVSYRRNRRFLRRTNAIGSQSESTFPNPENQIDIRQSPENDNIQCTRSGRVIRKPKWLHDYVLS